jgi:hypothetical protein
MHTYYGVARLMILMEMDWGWAIFSWSKQENQKEGTISL